MKSDAPFFCFIVDIKNQFDYRLPLRLSEKTLSLRKKIDFSLYWADFIKTDLTTR